MILGIGGVSRSGKSSLARELISSFPGKRAIVLDQDNYVNEEGIIPRINGETDWESPESMNFRGFYEALVEASGSYELVIGEGILVFWDPLLADLFQKKILVQISRELFRERKVQDKRWGDFPKWYVDHIWDSYQKYGTTQKKGENLLIVDGSRPFDLPGILDFLGLPV